MKKEEFEYRITNCVCELIDDIIPGETFLGKVKNATAKYWVEQNMWRLDEIVSTFTDRNNDIDETNLVKTYENVLFEEGELRVVIKDIVPEKFQNILPDKVILFKKEDLYKLLGLERPEIELVTM